jgi:hypothetical protein
MGYASINLGDAYMTEGVTGRARGGAQRAKNLTKEQRSEIARQGAAARWATDRDAEPLKASYGTPDRPLRIGSVEIPCYVLGDGTRVLAQRGLQSGIGLSMGGGYTGARRIAELMESLAKKGIDTRDLGARVNSPIRFIPPHGGNPADGYEATILPDICAVLIDAGQKEKLGVQRKHLAERAALLQHGFATIGIIALVDEATGYQADRAKDALARILEQFIAKELQPYVPTFDAEFYQLIFKLRGLEYSPDSVKRPQYFGTLTNDIVYKRLAPGVLAELKKVTPKNDSGRHKDKLFQRLTSNKGYPKLREHLGSLKTIMSFSSDWHDFMNKLNSRHPRFGEQLDLPFPYMPDKDDGKGL